MTVSSALQASGQLSRRPCLHSVILSEAKDLAKDAYVDWMRGAFPSMPRSFASLRMTNADWYVVKCRRVLLRHGCVHPGTWLVN